VGAVLFGRHLICLEDHTSSGPRRMQEPERQISLSCRDYPCDLIAGALGEL